MCKANRTESRRSRQSSGTQQPRTPSKSLRSEKQRNNSGCRRKRLRANAPRCKRRKKTGLPNKEGKKSRNNNKSLRSWSRSRTSWSTSRTSFRWKRRSQNARTSRRRPELRSSNGSKLPSPRSRYSRKEANKSKAVQTISSGRKSKKTTGRSNRPRSNRPQSNRPQSRN